MDETMQGTFRPGFGLHLNLSDGDAESPEPDGTRKTTTQWEWSPVRRLMYALKIEHRREAGHR
jgi:hypothetical protein